jgi:hypothetical protein
MRGFAAAWIFDGHGIPQAATTIKSLPKTACRMKKSIRENALLEIFPPMAPPFLWYSLRHVI